MWIYVPQIIFLWSLIQLIISSMVDTKVKRKYSRKRCCVPECTYDFDRTTAYYQIPSVTNIRRLWMKLLHLDETKLTHRSVVCSYHFTSDSYISYPAGPNRKALKRNAIPLPISSEIEVDLSEVGFAQNVELQDDPLHVENQRHLAEYNKIPQKSSEITKKTPEIEEITKGRNTEDFLRYLGGKLRLIKNTRLYETVEMDILKIVRNRINGEYEQRENQLKKCICNIVRKEHDYCQFVK